MYMYMCVYAHIYLYVSMYRGGGESLRGTRPRLEEYLYMYIYIYICVNKTYTYIYIYSRGREGSERTRMRAKRDTSFGTQPRTHTVTRVTLGPRKPCVGRWV